MQDVITVSLPVPIICLDGIGINNIIKQIRDFKLIAEVINTDLQIYFKQSDLSKHDLNMFVNDIIEMIKDDESEALGIEN